MTATAFALDPDLDFFDDVDTTTLARPDLRVIHGNGSHGNGSHRNGSHTNQSRGAKSRYLAPLGSPSAPAASVEVYRRRRFLALIAVTALVLTVAWAAGISLTSFTASAGEGPVDLMAQSLPAVHVVLPGDSYAAIAASLGATNPVAGAELLRGANGGSELVVGQRLIIDAALFPAAG